MPTGLRRRCESARTLSHQRDRAALSNLPTCHLFGRVRRCVGRTSAGRRMSSPGPTGRCTGGRSRHCEPYGPAPVPAVPAAPAAAAPAAAPAPTAPAPAASAPAAPASAAPAPATPLRTHPHSAALDKVCSPLLGGSEVLTSPSSRTSHSRSHHRPLTAHTVGHGVQA